ncbi:MAG: saccharopine dehydrogenase NADP-binding domain-containing protein [Solirubrobacteraceae bacterium]|nr:saccharopine dehydrogenase NADP-binding domain-containing protein [Solirubrobacteraceae bacterium]
MATPAPSRTHDLVLYGASGFVGKLTAKYLAESAPPGTKIALGGRSKAKLEAVRSELPAVARDWPIVIADSQDDAALAKLAASTTVVVTTVGPYQRYGLPLVKACADAGTHYADLTGEVLFMRQSIDAANARAKETGARIVHTCGFDSIPSDLGVLTAYEYAQEIGAGTLEDVTFVVSMSGGISGGTIDSMRAQLEQVAADKSHAKTIFSPYSLTDDRESEPDVGKQPDPKGVSKDPDSGAWLAPFVMSQVNTRVVRRSNALRGHAYGRRFKYQEYMRAGSGPAGAVTAGVVVGALGGLMGGMSFSPTRKLLDRVLPKPGEGPSEKARDKGYFKVTITAGTSSGKKVRVKVKASGDPGYKATAVMLGEAGLSLALDGDALPDAAGVLTPATAMGNVLTDRLRAAGQTYDAETVL